MSASQPAPGEQPAAADTDPCAAVLGGHFDMPLHVAAVFIIMATSFAGTVLPVLGKRLVRSEAGRTAITLLKLFGAGVIVATALVHMFVPANETLTNACLPRAFSRDYKAFAAVFAIAGIFVTHAVQVFAAHAMHRQASRAAHGHGHDHGHDHDHDRRRKTSIEYVDDSPVVAVVVADVDSASPAHDHIQPESAVSSTPTSSDDLTRRPAHHSSTAEVHVEEDADMHEGHSHGGLMLHTREKQLVVLLLELGIASHSVIIGLTLGIATDEFKTLLIALCFHQFFEGLALSAIVLDAGFRRWTMAFGMVVFYTLTTPAGIALGIVVRESFNANATQTLLATGVLDAVSAGILIYDALVNVIYPHFSAASFRRASSGFQLVQLLAMYLGCALMSLIGLWALTLQYTNIMLVATGELAGVSWYAPEKIDLLFKMAITKDRLAAHIAQELGSRIDGTRATGSLRVGSFCTQSPEQRELFAHQAPNTAALRTDRLVFVSHKPTSRVAGRPADSASVEEPAPASGAEQLVVAVQTCEYVVGRTLVVNVAKVDSSGSCSDTLRGVASGCVRALVGFLAKQASIDGLESLQLHVFARAQPQYLFHRSASRTSKRTLSPSALVKWWIRVLDGVSSDLSVLAGTAGTVERTAAIPGENADSPAAKSLVGALLGSQLCGEGGGWQWGLGRIDVPGHEHPVFPCFPDDPVSKAIAMLDHGKAASESDVLGMLGIVGECQSTCALFSVRASLKVKEPNDIGEASGPASVATSLAPVEFEHLMGQWLSASFADEDACVASTHRLLEIIAEKAGPAAISEPVTMASKAEQSSAPNHGAEPGAPRVMQLQGLVKRKPAPSPSATPQVHSLQGLVKRKRAE